MPNIALFARHLTNKFGGQKHSHRRTIGHNRRQVQCENAWRRLKHGHAENPDGRRHWSTQGNPAELCGDHAWIPSNTVRRAITLLSACTLDRIRLDCGLAGKENGDIVASCARSSAGSQVEGIVRFMSSPGVNNIRDLRPQSELVPLSKVVRNNAASRRIRAELANGAPPGRRSCQRESRSDSPPPKFTIPSV